VERIPTDRKVVALTFDAGANADAVPAILATLAAERVRGTFFLTGDFVRQFPRAARSIAGAGHRLANHSASHPHFTALGSPAIRDQLRTAEQEIRATTGADPRPLFRFPFGDRDARTIGTVNQAGYLPVRWTVDTLGWQGTSGGRSAAEVTSRVLDTARPGQIVLMHVGSHPTDGSTLDSDALPAVIAGLRQRGYQFVTLNTLLTG
jgi:peptidoglycan/xylan/chitin deacetylase (PgdA/CDA1 family)